jgi:hypothetical protein
VVHKTWSAVMLADMEAPSTVTVRLINFTPSDLHIRQLKSSTIGVLAVIINLSIVVLLAAESIKHRPVVPRCTAGAATPSQQTQMLTHQHTCASCSIPIKLCYLQC